MNCSEVQELLSAYYDKEILPEVGKQVGDHVKNCPDCSSELASFRSLSAMVSGSEVPVPNWSPTFGAEKSIAIQKSESDLPGPVGRQRHNRRSFFKYAAAVAATVLIGFLGFRFAFHGNHEHREMVEAMEYVAANLSSDNISTHLLQKFGGSDVSSEDVYTQVGYRPVVSQGLPSGYSVESMHILDMPCCKCTQTACRRPDNSRFLIFEHGNEETGWFDHRNKRQCRCGEKECEVVDMDDGLVATFRQDNRLVTLIGIRDEQEIELLVNQFGQNL